MLAWYLLKAGDCEGGEAAFAKTGLVTWRRTAYSDRPEQLMQEQERG
jgi:hypothetical protein